MAGDAGPEDGYTQRETSTDSSSVSGDIKVKGAAIQGKRDVQPDVCTICLEPISERAVAVPCNHLTFDFLCLVSWLQARPSCPLCNAEVREVQYDWRSPEDFKTYHVPGPDAAKVWLGNARQIYRGRRGREGRLVGRRSTRTEESRAADEDTSLERRRQVYRSRLFSLHVGANRLSQYRDFTPETFAASPELQSRARAFLRRELQVFSFLDTAAAPRGGNRDFLIEYIVAILKTTDPKDASGHAEDLLAEFLGRENARLLLHELEAWLRSPYARLQDWDRHVQYAGND